MIGSHEGPQRVIPALLLQGLAKSFDNPATKARYSSGVSLS